MVNILIYGINGKMGRMVYNAIAARDDARAVCGVDKNTDSRGLGLPIYPDINEVTEKVDCIIDFSVKSALYEILPYAEKHNIPCVLATTGYDSADAEYIKEYSKKLPIFRTGNLSVGIRALVKLVEKACELLGDKADIEIIECHHNQKVDSPSGTALMLYEGAKAMRPDLEPVYGREGIVGKRKKNEVGIHAVRGGTIVGKHEVMFIMDNEVITLSHEAESKAVFANGSVNAAIFLQGKEPGLYNMNDMIK
jgi:4-hydroxy-tetrahydrodipicolinate reductase